MYILYKFIHCWRSLRISFCWNIGYWPLSYIIPTLVYFCWIIHCSMLCLYEYTWIWLFLTVPCILAFCLCLLISVPWYLSIVTQKFLAKFFRLKTVPSMETIYLFISPIMNPIVLKSSCDDWHPFAYIKYWIWLLPVFCLIYLFPGHIQIAYIFIRCFNHCFKEFVKHIVSLCVVLTWSLIILQGLSIGAHFFYRSVFGFLFLLDCAG